MLLLLLYDWLFCWEGGCGRAKGLGGPDAPALRMALALGDGGGSTTPVPEEWLASVLAFLGVAPVCCSDDSSVALSASDCSSGICTFSLGLLAFDWEVSVRAGGGKSIESARLGTVISFCGLGGGGVGLDCGCSGCDSFSRLISNLVSLWLLPMAQCCASRDLESSMGVKIL